MICYQKAKVPTACLPKNIVNQGSYDADLDPALEVDIWVEGTRIEAVTLNGSQSTLEATTTHDLKGQLLWPGMVDAHMHLDKAHTWNRAPNPKSER